MSTRVAAPAPAGSRAAARGHGGAAAAPAVAAAWAQPAERVCAALRVDAGAGLSGMEVERRRQRHGRNVLRPRPPVRAVAILLRQFASLVVGLLLAALVAALLSGHWFEAVAIGVVVLANAAIGFATELRAVRSMESLRRLGQAMARVRRDGELVEVEAASLVPGDIVLLEAGEVIGADVRLLEASNLQADEATLTGESVPVDKDAAPVPADTVLAERSCMLWKGTMLTRGAGTGVCVATGAATELGRIAALASSTGDATTPLERRLERLARRLIHLTLAIAVVTVVVGILCGRDPATMVSIGIALAVAAIPEGLPVVATLALARGLWRLARRHALVNRLSAVETLGATNVILTDKTGTLTENHMTVVQFDLDAAAIAVEGLGLDPDGAFVLGGAQVAPTEHAGLQSALEIGVLCNNAGLVANAEAVQPVGDPMEVALLVVGAKAGVDRQQLLRRQPERREIAFDPRVRAMATYHDAGAHLRVAVKGAVETLLPACTFVLRKDGTRAPLDGEARRQWLLRSEQRAARGLRMLALAEKEVADLAAPPFEQLTLAGVVAMLDPPRAEVQAALDECRAAGVRVIMVTGDHAGTARSIAAALGLIGNGDAVVEGRRLGALDREQLLAVPVFARVEPEQKLQLIALHQQHGAVVAMTGDGVNDAPALRQADIGIAMGRRGTQVAREAADMVLQDDSFASIVQAIRQGRAIFANIRRFVVYLMSCNLSEVLVVFAASSAGLPLPVLPLQILYLNLVTDVFPALALGFGAGASDAMRVPPRPAKEPILTRGLWAGIGVYGLLIAGSVLASLLLARDWLLLSAAQAVTVSFLTLALAQLWHVFDMRERGSKPWRNDVVGNPWVWAALGVCVALLVLAVHGPLLPALLGTEHPGGAGAALAVLCSLLPVACGQTWLWLGRRRR